MDKSKGKILRSEVERFLTKMNYNNIKYWRMSVTDEERC